MKQLFVSLLLILLVGGLAAQVPEAFSYQAVARDANGICIQDTVISLRISIYDSVSTGTLLYQEEFRNVSTNAQGLFSINIGKGISQPIGGITPQFADIRWADENKWMGVEMDPNNGFNFVLLGNQQLLSVPYAMAARQASTSDTAMITDTAIVALNVVGEPVGTVKMFWDAGGMLPIPSGWHILDGSVVNDPLSSLNGIQLPDMTNRYAVGKMGNNDTLVSGNANHIIDLSHSHIVDNHQHSLASHTHTMSHTHSSGTYSALFGWDNQGDVGVRKGSFSSYGAWGTPFNDALNTEGNLSFSNVGTSEFASNTSSIDVAGNSGSSSSGSTGSGGGGSTGSTSPGTSNQLSVNQSIQPESIGFIYIIKIR